MAKGYFSEWFGMSKIMSNKTRLESDSIGTIKVPAEHYWGAQTQRSLIYFAIGNDRMPKAIYHAYGYIKKAAAIVNLAEGILSKDKADLIIKVSDEIIDGILDGVSPLRMADWVRDTD